jgi:hypothetical protein
VSRNPFYCVAPLTVDGLDADPDCPSGRGFIALLEAFRATGGAAPAAVLGRLLDEHPVDDLAGLAELLACGRLFGFEWRDSLWIPMFQFAADGLVLHGGAREVRAELPSHWSAWTVATWFAAPNAQLRGCRPADLLDAGLADVLSATRLLESHPHVLLPTLRQARGVGAQY